MPDPSDASSDPSLRTLDVDERQIAAARAFVRTRLASLGLPLVEDVELLTSEVVSNAVEHAVTEHIVLRVRAEGSRVRVEAHDDDPTPPHLEPLDPTRPGGLGMRLVAALADDWGVEEIAEDGKVVWFELDLPGSELPVAPAR